MARHRFLMPGRKPAPLSEFHSSPLTSPHIKEPGNNKIVHYTFGKCSSLVQHRSAYGVASMSLPVMVPQFIHVRKIYVQNHKKMLYIKLT